MTSFQAVDLSLVPGANRLWRRGTDLGLDGQHACRRSELLAKFGLPDTGFASPMGFWFAPPQDWTQPAPYRLEVSPPSRSQPISAASAGPSVDTDLRQGSVVLKQTRRLPLADQSSRVTIEVAGRSARIEADESAWPDLRPVAFLAVATCWRLEFLDASIDRLTACAGSELERHTAAARPRHPGTRLSSTELHKAGNALILDLPDFEGPLTDPMSFLRSRAAARLYERLCERLGLFAWRNRIDERAEVLEAALAVLATRRDHRQSIALQVGLELLIILLLAADLALSLYP